MYLLVDIGGTKTRVALSDDGRAFRDVTTYDTPGTAERGIDRLTQYANQQPPRLTGVVIGIPGVLDRKLGELTASPNLPGWVKKPLRTTLEKKFGTPVSLINDASLAGLGEAFLGAGRGHRIVVYLTISTGIGGARIVGGRIDDSAVGFEPGHMIIDAAGALCPSCSKPTTLEALAGGANVERRLKLPPREIKDPRVWEEAAYHLALGLNNVVMLWSPHVIILGGSMMRDIKIDRVTYHLNRILTIGAAAPPVVAASLANDERALFGALACLQHQTGEHEQAG